MCGFVFMAAAAWGAPPDDPAVRRLAHNRDLLDKTVWRPEIEAQAHEEPLVKLWDAVRAAPEANRLKVVGEFAFEKLTLGETGPMAPLKDGITTGKTTGEKALTPAEWRDQLAAWSKAGWRIVQLEVHHEKYEPAIPRSTFKFSVHATRGSLRRIVRGAFVVTWTKDSIPRAATIEAPGLDVLDRTDQPVFAKAFDRVFDRKALHALESSLLSADLNEDGRPEIILPSVNLVFTCSGDGKFTERPLFDHPAPLIGAAVIADFDRDGHDDCLVLAGEPPQMKALLYRGDGSGTFHGDPVPACSTPLPLEAPAALTVGDINGDGTLDVWIGQYKAPYADGAMPVPYDDARDGYPAILLLGDGHGGFKDATMAAGFGDKLNRRAYGGSFLDVDGDGHLDLVAVNDFAGADIWLGDGHGHFRDGTADVIGDPANFGMSLVVDDFDGDGELDLFVTGMASTTARRLSSMGLVRRDQAEVAMTRTRMGYGNRLYLHNAPGRYREPAWGLQIARSGWSWGAQTLDVDNDGTRDLYVLNGNQSGKSAEDYCTRFWCHDIYPDRRATDAARAGMLELSNRSVREGETSWNGYEKKRFFLCGAGPSYTEAAFLLGVSEEEDARCLVAGDFDLDGRPDLALIYKTHTGEGANRVPGFGLRIFLNRLTTSNHWLGVRLHGAGNVTPWGAKITVIRGSHRQGAAVVAGDSWRSQQPLAKLFGLGSDPSVDAVEIRWPGGKTSRLDHPSADRYYDVSP